MKNRKIKDWNRLDNAAKIFPPTSSNRDTKVFRFVCELYEEVNAEVLQYALDKTMSVFPYYRSILRQGLFWYYLEESDFQPEVKEETDPPCLPLYNPDQLGLLFRVLYYKKRIHLEVFHALADGTGALHFFRFLIFSYLSQTHQDVLDHGLQLDDYDASQEQKRLDAFYKYYEKEKKPSPAKMQKAYRIRGRRIPDNRIGIIEGILSAKAVLEKAHEKNATMSEFLTALLICSIFDGMDVRDRSRPVVISIPVNLRKYFPTQTARNFFGVIKVSHHFKYDGNSFEDVLENVRRSFREQLVADTMLGIINRYSAIESHPVIKGVPLVLKIPFLKVAGWQAESKDSAAFSNIGKISMPPEVSSYIRLFDVFLHTKRPQICLCSYEDKLAVSFSSPLVSTDVQRCFFRRLTELGMSVEIASNLEQEMEGRELNNVVL